ncbi:MAG: GNAT family N-acetyltransferase, partial [Gammaproteobacteria bacterium]|nr:GNAT family N-acetyltransferase [Gammaproteobacteria bacterium]
MSRIIEIETDRLRLRQWKETDYALFADLNADPEVMKYFPNALSKEDSDCFAIKLQSLIQDRGWGLWALELKSSGEFIGYTGLYKTDEELSFSPAIEI